MNELPLKKLEGEATLLSLDSKAAQAEITAAENRGEEVTEAMYQAAIDTAKAENKNLALQQMQLAQTRRELEADPDLDRSTNQEWIDN